LPRYYTGIHFERLRGAQRIRVLLQHSRGVIVKGDSHALITSASHKVIAATRRGRVYFWIQRSGAATVVNVATSPRAPWRRVGSVTTTLIRVAGARSVGIVGPGSTRWYRGVIDLVPSGRGLDVIDNLPLESYVSEVVPREMPASWPGNALKAQAVAVRTYALRVSQVARARHKNHDICATTACQVFGGYARMINGSLQGLESRSSNNATWSTAGWIMTWRGKPILAEYSSSTGGYTTSGGVPYLSPRPDPWDLASPFHSWSEAIDLAQVQANWPAVGSVRSVRVVARDGRGDFGGRALSLLISGSRGSMRVSAPDFQYTFGLPSDWFRLLASSRQYRFTFNMSYGDHNAAVRFLQERLRSIGVYPKTAPLSNYFGPITRASLERYQRAQHINPTGFLGPRTRARLNATAS
jgi:SpoIID/LytB domain protein